MFEYQMVFWLDGVFVSKTDWKDRGDMIENMSHAANYVEAFDFNQVTIRKREIMPHTVLTIEEFLAQGETEMEVKK